MTNAYLMSCSQLLSVAAQLLSQLQLLHTAAALDLLQKLLSCSKLV